MPLYAWVCPTCSATRERILAIADCYRLERCECGVEMTRELTPVSVNADITPYRATTGDKAGQFITSRREHREFLKRNRLVEVGTAPIQSTAKMRKTTDRHEVRAAIRDTTRKLLKPDLKHGGLTERKG